MTGTSFHLRALALTAAVALSGCSLAVRQAVAPETATQGPVRTPSAQVMAFCGPSTANPHWRTQLATLADIGVTAVHGYCYTPPENYTVLEPGARYASQGEYLTLADEARRLGIGVIAYDPMFWTDPEAARLTWGEYISDGTLVAVDLGDEPWWPDMAELRRRADLVRTTGATPHVILFGGSVASVLDQHAAIPMPCPNTNDYTNPAGSMLDTWSLHAVAGCAAITLDTTGRDMDGDGDWWSVGDIRRARANGFRLTLFTGVQPENFPTWDALVDDYGRMTDAGRAVREALG